MKKPRTRTAMIAYLGSHFRYDTMNSWNRGTSFARNIKLSRITFSSREAQLRAYGLVNVEEAFSEFNLILHEFSLRHSYCWKIGKNGRSGGYLVLYSVNKKDTGYKSYCPSCGQRNYKMVPS